MTEPAKDASFTIDTRVPIDILIELVENRIRSRRQATRWRYLGLAVGLASLAVTVASLLFNWRLEAYETAWDTQLEQTNTRLRQEALSRAGDEFSDVEDLNRFANAQPASVGTTRVALGERERALFSLEVESTSSYRIEAEAVGRDAENTVDTVLFLYRRSTAGAEPVAFDDDSGDEFNARIERELEGPATYFLEVGGLFGGSGPVNLSIGRDLP